MAGCAYMRKPATDKPEPAKPTPTSGCKEKVAEKVVKWEKAEKG